MAKEYIERGAALTITKMTSGDYMTAFSEIRQLPAADVVEVVRCKDCRFCKKHPTSDKVKICTNEQQWVTECYPLVHDNDYCSYGEREEV